MGKKKGLLKKLGLGGLQAWKNVSREQQPAVVGEGSCMLR